VRKTSRNEEEDAFCRKLRVKSTHSIISIFSVYKKLTQRKD
jgi:hypothetical protein